MSKIMLNDLLKFTTEELKSLNIKIRFSNVSKGKKALDAYCDNSRKFNSKWFLWRSKKNYFNVGEEVISFVRLPGEDLWLITAIVKIRAKVSGNNKIGYKASDDVERANFADGRVVVRYRKAERTVVRLFGRIADQIEVVKILPSRYIGERFPSYDNVLLSYTQLQRIVDNGYEDWLTALRSVSAVYVLTDLKNGKHYVGSAYGKGGLYGRWAEYVKTKHGYDKYLKKVAKKENGEYIQKHFQFAILEEFSLRTQADTIIGREQHWKRVLDSSKHGYNVK